MAQAVLGPPPQADLALYEEAVLLCRLGMPRLFIETYFKVAPEAGSGLPPLTPMLFSNEPNQEWYYDHLFKSEVWEEGHPGVAWQPWVIDAICLKDRKARWTAFVAACLTAKMFCVPGTHVLCVVNAEDTFPVIHAFMDGFYRNMPEWARPMVVGNAWGMESKTVTFPMPGGGQMTSSFVIRTAATANVGTGATPTDEWWDEYMKFPSTFSKEVQGSLRAALPAGGSLWRGGTVGPAGKDCIAYDEIQQYKKGLVQLDYLFRASFMNPANKLAPKSRERRPADMEDDKITAGVRGGPNCEREPMLIAQFPDDGIPWQWRIAWRRAKMRDAALAAGENAESDGVQDTTNTVYQREHCEDDESAWRVPGVGQFSQTFMDTQGAIAKAPENLRTFRATLTTHGLQRRVYRPWNPEHVYCAGTDLGSGQGGDDSALELLDVTSMTFIGGLFGNMTDVFNTVTDCITFLKEYGNAMLVIETNRFPSIGDFAHNTLKYDNVWMPPKRANESFETWRGRRHYGINVGGRRGDHAFVNEHEPNALALNDFFKADFNNGVFGIVSPDLLKTMDDWDPNRQPHTPDRLAAARLVRLGVGSARALQPVTGVRRESAELVPWFRAGGGPVRPFRIA